MTRSKILLATRNKGKIAELNKLLADFNLEVTGLESFPHIEEIEETGKSFEENALLKACHAAKYSGLVCLADDSGLRVRALGGAPGIYSARYSASPGQPATDESNIAKLLRALRDIPHEERQAEFCCAIAACAPNGKHITAYASWPGIILPQKRGVNGFGYDPVFLDPELQLSAAEMTREQKNSRSHRARALAELRKIWPDFWDAL